MEPLCFNQILVETESPHPPGKVGTLCFNKLKHRAPSPSQGECVPSVSTKFSLKQRAPFPQGKGTRCVNKIIVETKALTLAEEVGTLCFNQIVIETECPRVGEYPVSIKFSLKQRASAPSGGGEHRVFQPNFRCNTKNNKPVAPQAA